MTAFAGLLPPCCCPTRVGSHGTVTGRTHSAIAVLNLDGSSTNGSCLDSSNQIPSEKEENGRLQRRHDFHEAQRQHFCPHSVEREGNAAQNVGQIEDRRFRTARTTRPNFHKDMPPGWPSTRSSHVRSTHNFLAV